MGPLYFDTKTFEDNAISPLREIGAYEALWDEKGATFKKISEKFSAIPDALPSDFVSTSKASGYAKFVLEKFRDALVNSFGVRIHGAGEYPQN